MADRYPHQDLSGALEGYLQDFERLAARFGLPRVQAAMAEWRIKPGAKFFPQPSEIAEEIENLMNKERKEFLKQHPIADCSVCDNLRMIPVERNGMRAMARCQCYINWKRSQQSQNTGKKAESTGV